ncbi:hypothetical protein G1H11_13915 [Phytoactinopolyspora alkaliphila]|uniref:Uncharacterized protein n=1 Tax=Phytoactinopolyspora alkaliphila TaxID=1783498 RepID=A0A6N9YN34_9ACTN|nr:hypothetical protein [Phytoactinopolyspora alkaliphila]NED96403.1 hypothetical protein [Phytoactinopolyspora alkaliphila]
MIDTSLVGYWSDDIMYSGATEANDLTFRPDGSGFTYWARLGDVFEVDRFTWHVDSAGKLHVRLIRMLTGTWTVRDNRIHHRVQLEDDIDVAHETSYALAAGRDVFGNNVSTLTLHRPILPAATVFALRKDGQDDPTAADTVSFGEPPAR